MKMKVIGLFLLAFVCSLTTMGQTTDVRKNINKIKKSTQYLSAEATLDSEEEALKTANELLVGEINDWVRKKRNSEDVKQIVLQDISSCSEKLNMKRGAKVRVFVYVRKRDIVLIKGAGQIVLSEEEKGNDLQPLAEVAGEMDLEKAEETAKEKPEKQTAGRSTANKADPQAEALSLVTGARTMAEMKGVFAQLKEENRITYGKYPTQDLPASYHLLFYTRSGDIRDVVRVSNGSHHSLHTGQEVQLSRFSGCAAYWFILK